MDKKKLIIPAPKPRDPFWKELREKGEKTHEDKKKNKSKKKCREKIKEDENESL